MEAARIADDMPSTASPLELQVPDIPLTRDQVVIQLGIPFAEGIIQLNELRSRSPESFTRDLETQAVLCKPEAMRQLLTDRAARGETSDSLFGLAAELREERVKKQAIEKFDRFAEEMLSGEYKDIDDFHKLVDILGQESSFDILLQFSKEYRDGKVPVEHVHGFLAELLGDFVADRGSIDFDALGQVKEYFKDKNLQQALTEVAKREVLRKYNAVRAEAANGTGQTTDDFDLLAEIIGEMQKKCAELNDDNLNKAMNEVDDYYLDVETMDLPANMEIDEYSSDRPFPDLNQRINIKEIADKRRMLIADAPGMGKSAAFIIAKERKQAKLGVIFTPKQVQEQESWQDYLSDQVDENGERVGYFKPGEAPRVLVVNGPRDLKEAQEGDFDYVIISHEKVTQKNLAHLNRLGADMICIDEAHLFKNILEGIRTEWIIDFCEGIDDLVLLTATPAPNKVTDIGLMLRLLFPDEFKATKEGEEITNADIVRSIMEGNLLDIRRKLLRNTQMKQLEVLGNIEEPLIQNHDIELTQAEKDAYAVVLEDWEMTSSVKLQVLRQIAMNTKLLEGIPAMESAKLVALIDKLGKSIEAGKSKFIVFVNDYVDDIIALRNGKRDASKLIVNDLKEAFPDLAVEVIHGDVRTAQRREIRRRFQKTDEPMIMVVSGSTVSVGVDFNRADEQHFLNRPWTKDQEAQEIGRSNRPGRHGRLSVHFYDSLGTIDQGIKAYVEAKHQAILKLLHGVPMSKIDQELVMSSEKKQDEVAEVHPELARYYVSAEEMERRIFGKVKEKGETWFRRFIDSHGGDYAEVYRQLTSRSYQANCSRLSGTLIKRLEEERAEIRPNQPLMIVDAGSGPEMLKKHAPEKRIAEAITSIDVNAEHFPEPSEQTQVASISQMPLPDNSADYVNLSLVLHYTSWWPSNEKDPDRFERLKVLAEANRVLKPNGHAIITLPYSLNIRDNKKFREVVEGLGFEVVQRYTGLVQKQGHFKAQVITLKKTAHSGTDMDSLLGKVGQIAKGGLRLIQTKRKPVDTKRFATDYSIFTESGRYTIPAELNETGKAIRDEEAKTLKQMDELRRSMPGKTIEEIPREEIEARQGWVRIKIHDRYVLFKQLAAGEGAIVYRG